MVQEHTKRNDSISIQEAQRVMDEGNILVCTIYDICLECDVTRVMYKSPSSEYRVFIVEKSKFYNVIDVIALKRSASNSFGAKLGYFYSTLTGEVYSENCRIHAITPTHTPVSFTKSTKKGDLYDLHL